MLPRFRLNKSSSASATATAKVAALVAALCPSLLVKLDKFALYFYFSMAYFNATTKMTEQVYFYYFLKIPFCTKLFNTLTQTKKHSRELWGKLDIPCYRLQFFKDDKKFQIFFHVFSSYGCLIWHWPWKKKSKYGYFLVYSVLIYQLKFWANNCQLCDNHYTFIRYLKTSTISNLK